MRSIKKIVNRKKWRRLEVLHQLDKHGLPTLKEFLYMRPFYYKLKHSNLESLLDKMTKEGLIKVYPLGAYPTHFQEVFWGISDKGKMILNNEREKNKWTPYNYSTRITKSTLIHG